MPCDKTALFDFLSVLNGDLSKKITLVATAGTAAHLKFVFAISLAVVTIIPIATV